MTDAVDPGTNGNAHDDQFEGRNLVVFMDGTGNQIDRKLSNILKIFRCAKKNDRQQCFYHPGVGTIARDSAWQRARQNINNVAGLATGYGLDENVVSAYRFLVANWRDGDRIFLFGFSRGAWTVRVLGGLVHMIGLLRPEQLALCDHALGAYKKAAGTNDFSYAWHFASVLSARRAPIRFMGCFDTVASVIVPRRDRAYIPSLETLPWTEENPSVEIFRHAMAIDERRRMFRLSPWKEKQEYRPYLSEHSISAAQDVRQMWFAGVHSDVGGGYTEEESALAKIPLGWMMDEAQSAGFEITKSRYNQLVHGKKRKGSKYDYVSPDPLGPIHKSLTWGWQPLEILPKRKARIETRKSKLPGVYFPLGEPRAIAPDSMIHPSVRERIEGDSFYRPPNLPVLG